MKTQASPTTDRETRATAAINRLLQVWESGNLPGYIERSVIARQADDSPRPCDAWSIGNQILMLLEGTDDARGFRQWQDVGRRVRKGEKAFFIFAPCTRKVTESDTSTGQDAERTIVTGFRLVPVFAYESTEGDELAVPEYAPVQLPPLIEVAQRWGIDVSYSPFTGRDYGYYAPGAKRIVLKTHDELTFFHELAHAAHDRIATLKPGQDAAQEIVAETAGAALCLLYGFEPGFQTVARSYVASYANLPQSEVRKAVFSCLSDIQKVLELIFSERK